MGPGDRPVPGEGPGWDIPPVVSEGVDIYQIDGTDPDTAEEKENVQCQNASTIFPFLTMCEGQRQRGLTFKEHYNVITELAGVKDALSECKQTYGIDTASG